jgi:hypothetical protein
LPAFEELVQAGLAALHRRFAAHHGAAAASIPSCEAWLGQVETTQKHLGNEVDVTQCLADTLKRNGRSRYQRVGVEIEWRAQVKGAVAGLVEAIAERRAVAAADAGTKYGDDVVVAGARESH